MKYLLNRYTRIAASVALLGFAVTAQAATLTVTADLITQLDGTNVSSTGGLVDSWNDQAVLGGSQNFTQTGATRPTLLTGVSMPNGTIHNVVDFDDNVAPQNLIHGADSAMDNMDLQTWYLVTRFDDPGTQNGGFQGAYANGGSSFIRKINTEISGGKAIQSLYFSAPATITQKVVDGSTPYAPSDGEWILISGVWNMTLADVNGVNAGIAAIKVFGDDGLLKSSGSKTVTGAFGTHVRSVLGNRGDLHGARDMDGAIAELLVYNDILSGAEQASVESYLLDKYFNTVIPEPSSLLLIALGSGVLGLTRKRRS